MHIFHIVLATIILISTQNKQAYKNLFNGTSLNGWQVIDIEGHGDVIVVDSCIIIGAGQTISGIKWLNNFPKTNYEVSLEAKRIEGFDFFCGMTFPINNSFLTLVIGGWGGVVVGLSCIDGYDADNNVTFNFSSTVDEVKLKNMF